VPRVQVEVYDRMADDDLSDQGHCFCHYLSKEEHPPPQALQLGGPGGMKTSFPFPTKATKPVKGTIGLAFFCAASVDDFIYEMPFDPVRS